MIASVIEMLHLPHEPIYNIIYIMKAMFIETVFIKTIFKDSKKVRRIKSCV